jgi:quercetin dioxygenase-like cupin family protein
MSKVVVSIDKLPLLSPPGRGPMPGRHVFEGAAFGLSHLTLTLGVSPPGQSTRLHRHEAEELIIVHAGHGTYTVGDTTIEAGPGSVVIIPSGTPHRWENQTQEPLVHTGVFPTDRFALAVEDE